VTATRDDIVDPYRPRLLYLAFYFPPTRASGVYRSRATANHFAAAGWDVTVITPQREFFRDYIRSYDPSLEASVDPRIRVERVPTPTARWERDLHRFGRLRGNFPALAARMRQRWDTLAFPEAYGPWIPGVVRRARALHRERPFDLVLATGNPHAAFGAAWLLHRLYRTPYVVDYRDSWTLDLYHDRPAFPDRSAVSRWERRILRDAARATFVNEALLDWHRRRYPTYADRMGVLANGWEPDLLGEPATTLPAPDRPLRFGYLGTMTRYMPLEEFFEGWRLARKEPAIEDASVRMYGHLGYFQNTAGQIRSVIPVDEGINVSYAGPVRKADAASVYDSLDVLLLILAGSKYVTSGKVYEYLATGKPIVSVHDPQCAAREPLRDYPLLFPARSLEPAAICDALVEAATAARSMTADDLRGARSYARRFTRDVQLAPFERDLRTLVRLGS